MKIAINRRYGGFGLSKEARQFICERKGINIDNFYDFDLERNDKDLIDAIELLGDDASDGFAELKIVDIPDNVQWTIEEYDGIEWVSEKHITWD